MSAVRRPALALAVLLTVLLTVLLALAACGGAGGSGGSGGADDGVPTADPSATTAAAATTAIPDEPTEGSVYLPVPDGVELTGPGEELALGEGAVAAWEPRQDLVGVVEVAVERLQRTTTRRALAGYDFQGTLDPAATPYLVTAQVDNDGDTDLGGRRLPLYAVDSAGTLVAPTDLDRSYELCPGSTLPAVFAPGDAAATCLLFFVGGGRELDAVVFRPADGVVPLTWTGAVVDLPAPRPTRSPS